LKYDSMGGSGELPKLIGRVHEASKKADIPLRAVVFADSDSRFPGDTSGAAAAAIRDTCERLGVPYALLGKRAIENYVPDEAIAEWSGEPERTSARPSIAALLRLTPTQRDYFPFKKGLSFLEGSLDSNHPAEEHDLYSDVSPQDRTLLERGFGKDFVMVLYATELGSEVDGATRAVRSSLTVESLRRRDRRGDLDALVALIEEQL
jgi:hypothetical protein